MLASPFMPLTQSISRISFPISISALRGRHSVGNRTVWRGVCALFALCILTAMASPAQNFKVLADFNNSTGAHPVGESLVQGPDGNFYGTANYSGHNSSAGTVFRLEPSGPLAAIYTFCSNGCSTGAHSISGLVLNTDGNFHGSTTAGGLHQQGTIFKITPSGTLTTIYNFCALTNCVDGREASGAMVRATNGNFYGTTLNGGGHGDSGAAFEITPTGTFTKIYGFCALSNCLDGSYPHGLIQGNDGNFYGTTEFGGAQNGGTVFKLSPGGTLTTLYSFWSPKAGAQCPEGSGPSAPLVQANDGNFYGTTTGGGANMAGGTVFKITASGTLSTLHSFCSQTNCADGSAPYALIQATDGKLYGVTGGGGSGNSGSIFQITLQGALATLYKFCSQTNCADGEMPNNGLLQATDGNFYGTTYIGGTSSDGVAFRLSTGLSPFVRTLPISGKIGSVITILGTDLTSPSSVSFKGTAAAFTVVSSSEIRATVPAGATSGLVKVTTPSRTLSSAVVFRVLP